MTDDDLVTALAGQRHGLVIVNSRAHALALYRKAIDAELEGVLHLTTRQYAAHRREILADVRKRLSAEDGRSCRLIATSLVEAGVDLDFPGVWRAEAGLDQIAQAAGRCNREGQRPVQESVVTVFRPAEFKPPREIAQLAADFERAAGRHDDLLSLDAIRDYFGEVYWRKGEELDANGVIPAFKCDASGTDFPYRTVAEQFRLIESGLAPVIIARDRAATKTLARLTHPEGRAGRAARELQTFVVQVPPKARALCGQRTCPLRRGADLRRPVRRAHDRRALSQGGGSRLGGGRVCGAREAGDMKLDEAALSKFFCCYPTHPLVERGRVEDRQYDYPLSETVRSGLISSPSSSRRLSNCVELSSAILSWMSLRPWSNFFEVVLTARARSLVARPIWRRAWIETIEQHRLTQPMPISAQIGSEPKCPTV